MSNYPGALSGGFVSHRFVSLKPDQPDLSVINASNWNQSHIIGSGAIQSGALGGAVVGSGNVQSGAILYGALNSGAVISGILASGAVPWKPFVVVTRSGPGNGGDYGPGTVGTTTAGLQEAINSLSSGGQVFITQGTYVLSNTVEVKSNVSLVGQDKKSVIITIASGKQINVLQVDSNSTIANLTVDGNGTNVSGTGNSNLQNGVYTASTTKLYVTDVIVQNCFYWGINLNNATTYGIFSRLYLFNNGIGGSNTGGFYMAGTSNQLIDSTFYKNLYCGIQCYSGSNLVANCIVDATQPQSGLTGGFGVRLLDAIDCNLTGLVVSNSYSNGIELDSLTTGCLRTNIANCIFYKNGLSGSTGGTGVITSLALDTAIVGCVAEGNIYGGFSFQSNSRHGLINSCEVFANTSGSNPSDLTAQGGIYVDQSCSDIVIANTAIRNEPFTGISIRGAPHCQILGCSIENNSQASGGGYYGITIVAMSGQTQNSLVQSNIITDTQTVKTQAGAIYETTASVNSGVFVVQYVNNSVGGNRTATISFFSGSASVARGNLGYNPVGNISAPIGSGFNGPFLGVAGTSGTGTFLSGIGSGITYVVQNTDLIISSVSGNPSIVITGSGGGTAIVSGVSSLVGIYLPASYQISWGAFTSAPTVTVFAN